MSKINLQIADLRHDIAPLFHKYKRQTNAQPAYVTLTNRGTVYADYSGDIGNGMPFAVFHGRD